MSVAPNNTTFPREAAENKPVVIELAGKQFQFREPPKLRADVLLARLRKHYIDLADDLPHMLESLAGVDAYDEDEVETALDARALTCLNELSLRSGDIWEDVAKALKIPHKKAEAMEADLHAHEVVLAGFQLMQVLQAPFGGGKPNTDQAAEADHSANGNSETPPCDDGESPGTL